MADVQEIQLKDPLSDVTRKERKLLLGVSLIGITIVKTGLIPEKIEALGVQFGKANQHALLIILSALTIYFLIAFVLYALSDFLSWRLALISSVRSNLKENPIEFANTTTKEFYHFYMHKSRVVYSLSSPVSILRACFEFILPLAVGIYAIIQLWNGI